MNYIMCIDKINKRNLSMLTDFYELTMMQGFFLNNMAERISVFDLYYRKNPFGNGYSVFAGLEQAIDYIINLNFSNEDIKFLREQNCFCEEFLDYLSEFKFTGDIYALNEGDVAFPNEPLLIVKAPLIQAQLLESALLNIINHQTLIATKANRIKQATKEDMIFEFGLRRAQSPDAAIYGTRASIIGGFNTTSNVLAGKLFGIPVSGTHSHSWVMSFDSELEAFRTYADLYPDNCILLIDTFDVLKSGLPNAIKVFEEKKSKLKRFGVRLDSGDFSYLTRKIRDILDKSGFIKASIVVSNDLDENLIAAIKHQKSRINAWGIGTKLITADKSPSLGGVYKLAALENKNGELIPKIKISENPEKISTPGFKQIFRIYDKNAKKIKADLLGFHDEKFLSNNNLIIFDPNTPWKKKCLEKNSYFIRKMLNPVIINGKVIYKKQNIFDIQNYCTQEVNSLWSEYKRLVNPEVMPVDLSDELFSIKQALFNSKKNLSQN